MFRRAAIDIGTNSVRLLVAEVMDSGSLPTPRRQQASSPPLAQSTGFNAPLRPVLRRLIITRLGERLDAGGTILPAAAARTAAAVEEFAALASSAGAPAPVVVGTYALRVAHNPEELLARLRLPVRVLDGAEEAQLGYKGALAGLGSPPPEGRVLVIDIGGGSVELTWGARGRIEETLSLPLGAVVLTERYFSHDPPSVDEIAALRAALGRILDPRLSAVPRRRRHVLGVGGTITTMAALEQQLVPYDPDRVHGFRLTRRAVEDITGRLLREPVADRRRLPGLQPERADIIPAGALVLQHLLARLACRHITVSEADLLWALVFDPSARVPGSGS